VPSRSLFRLWKLHQGMVAQNGSISRNKSGLRTRKLRAPQPAALRESFRLSLPSKPGGFVNERSIIKQLATTFEFRKRLSPFEGQLSQSLSLVAGSSASLCQVHSVVS